MSKKIPGGQHIEHLKAICADAGIKLTHQRLEIFKEMLAAKDHPSAEFIHRRLQKTIPTIALDTVYRTLATFDELGIIKKLSVMGERALFDINLDLHHHFVCTRCKKIQDLYWPEFDSITPPESAKQMGQITSRHLEIRGICNDCSIIFESSRNG